jgi:multidrug efflux pump subunit AcrA (membrane-fusion protein)
MEPRPIERTTEYVATVRSRESATLRPMAEGVITRIAVRSGDRVKAGDLVLEIDDSQQRAAVASLESGRAARVADLDFARREAERQRALFRRVRRAPRTRSRRTRPSRRPRPSLTPSTSRSAGRRSS